MKLCQDGVRIARLEYSLSNGTEDSGSALERMHWFVESVHPQKSLRNH